MNNKLSARTSSWQNIGNILSWLFGIAVVLAGLINTFWGNDPGFGIFLVLLSFVFFPPVTDRIQKKSGIPIPLLAKIILGVFIVWSALGVGELFDKIGLMLKDLR